MKEIKIFIRTDKQGSECEDVIFFADNVTDDEIHEYAKEVAFNFIDWGYEILSDTKEKE